MDLIILAFVRDKTASGTVRSMPRVEADLLLDTHGQNRVRYISTGNELKFWLLL